MSVANPTPLQIESFCLARIQGKNHTDSFRAAFPESAGGGRTATACGGRISRSLPVQARLAELKKIANRAAMQAATEDIAKRIQNLPDLDQDEFHMPRTSALNQIGI